MMKIRKILGRFIIATMLVIGGGKATLAEYVVYKTTKNMITRKTSLQEPSSKEFKAAYDIIIKYKWPTSVYTFYSDPNANTQKDEEISIRQELRRIFPTGNIEIAFVPDVIYEAAFLAPTVVPREGLENGQSVLLKILGETQWVKIIDRKVLQVLQNVKNSDEKTQYLAILKYMYDLNKNKNVISIAERVNKAICTVLRKDFRFIQTMNLESAPPQEKMFPSKLTKIKHFFMGDPRPSWNLSASISKYFQEFNNPQASWNKLLNKNISRDMIVKVAQLETEAHQKNEALIFRGSKQDSPLRFKSNDVYQKLATPEMQQREKILKGKTPEISESNTKPFSLSYGFSLMAGMAIESGGNVYNYTASNGLGYALKIDRKLFFDKKRKSPRNLFWVPPFGTIFSFYGVDDLFHPRTTVGMVDSMKTIKFDAQDYSDERGTTRKIDVDQFFSYSPIVWIVGVDKDATWNTKVAALVDYITTHAVAFYDPKNSIKDGHNILNYIHTDLLFLKEHQKNFASTLEQIKNNPHALKDPQETAAQTTKRRPLPPTPKGLAAQERSLPNMHPKHLGPIKKSPFVQNEGPRQPLASPAA